MWTSWRTGGASLVALLGCAACGAPAEQPRAAAPAASRPPPAFRGEPVSARVVPPAGSPRTIFRVRFRPRQRVGRFGRVRRGYEAHLRAEHDHASCIIDTGGYLDPRHPRRGIVLDPGEQMGNRWCRDRFTGSVWYFRAYACRAHGTCRPPKDFREQRRRVARIAFTVR